MQNKEKNFISAVIYVHNCQDRLEAFLDTILDLLQQNFEHSEIICVDDHSTDGSAGVIRAAGKTATTATVTAIHMSHFHGLESAMNAGMDLAIGDLVFEFDDTRLDFGPQELMKVYAHALKGYDIVSASPDKKQSLSSKLFYRSFRYFSDLHQTMRTERFRILSRRVINRIRSMDQSIPYRKAAYANCGLRTDHLCYSALPVPRCGPRDKREKKYRSRLAIDSLILFTDLGYRFGITMTLLMTIITLFTAIYSVIIYALGDPVAGWTTTILFLAVCFMGTFGVLTVIIKYLQILVDLVFKRKRYSFESIEKISRD